jgi:hypothetical protein
VRFCLRWQRWGIENGDDSYLGIVTIGVISLFLVSVSRRRPEEGLLQFCPVWFYFHIKDTGRVDNPTTLHPSPLDTGNSTMHGLKALALAFLTSRPSQSHE